MADEKINYAEWIKRAVWLLFIVITGYLLIASIFSTCYLGGYRYLDYSGEEAVNFTHTFYIRDHYLQHILLFVLTTFVLIKGAGTAGRMKGRILDKKYLPLMICIVAGIVAAAMVLAGGYEPKSDPRKVLDAAVALRHGDLSPLEKGAYLFRYPFQMGIILYFQILFVLFGEDNYMAFQLVNALWIVLSYYLYGKISDILWGKDHRYGIAVSLLGLFFFPYLLFTMLLYGTVGGMAFAMLSFYTLLLYDEKSKRGGMLALISGFSIGIAALLKPNYVIFMIAEVLYLLFSMLPPASVGRKRIVRKLMLAGAIVLCFMTCRIGVNKYLAHINHDEEVTGIPMIACAVMGLQEDGRGVLGPGWYNGYHTSLYEDHGYDYEETEEAAVRDLKKVLSNFLHNPRYTVGFFAKKTASQWNNPTFQSLLMLDGREGRGGMDWILKGNGRYLYILFANLIQTWILTGTFLYALFGLKSSSVRELLLPVTFIGGVLAHMFCMEAQSLSAMVYFPILIPLCIRGYGQWRVWLLGKKEEIARNGWQSECGKALQKKMAAFAAAAAVICALSYNGLFTRTFARNDDTGVFDTYTQEVVSSTGISEDK
ncbi:MAG: hypothetical protein NC434_02870 [Ruminococcus sp.]|nr:hypothetical protein [Ruminococcus sp.]